MGGNLCSGIDPLCGWHPFAPTSASPLWELGKEEPISCCLQWPQEETVRVHRGISFLSWQEPTRQQLHPQTSGTAWPRDSSQFTQSSALHKSALIHHWGSQFVIYKTSFLACGVQSPIGLFLFYLLWSSIPTAISHCWFVCSIGYTSFISGQKFVLSSLFFGMILVCLYLNMHIPMMWMCIKWKETDKLNFCLLKIPRPVL